MKVVTLDYNKLEELCRQLCGQISESGYRPDLFLGIRSGGAEVGRIMYNYAPEGCHYLECTTQRQGTGRKKRLMKSIIGKLPGFILNCLRILEAKLTFSYKRRSKIEFVTLPGNISQYKRILVIDDAVDSGATLRAVYDAIHRRASSAEIKSTAITVTEKHPVVMPDFFIYHNSTLLRFPWSMDAKKI